MNNSRTDSKDRAKFFNFQFPKYQEKTRGVFLSKYDFFQIPSTLLGEDPNAGDAEVISHPEDDISDEDNLSIDLSIDLTDYKPQPSKPLPDKQILDELDDIEQLMHLQSAQPKQLELIPLNPRTPTQSPPKRPELKEKEKKPAEKPLEARPAITAPGEPVQVTQAELDELLDEYLAMNIDI